MVYSDKPGRRIYLALQRRAQPADADLDDAKARYILEAAAKIPGASAADVYIQIRHRQGRHDITKAEVRQVLNRHRTFSLWPFRR